MRYFTRGWSDGELEEDESDRVRAQYQRRLEAIAARLPGAMLQLARDVSVQDATVESIRWTPASKTLDLSLIAGTREQGYRAIALTYVGALLGARRIDTLRRVARDREAEVLHHEVDVDDEGILSHRLLFWPSEELTIDFRELHLELTARADDRVSMGNAFVVVDVLGAGHPGAY